MNAPSPPDVWRVARAILPLPFAATVVVPGVIVAIEGANWGFGDGVAAGLLIAAGLVLISAGVGIFVWTVRLFASGGGTLAPWDPPTRLVVAGPYRHLRHPMITGVALVLAGETLVFGLVGLAIWLGIFVAINAAYLPLVEEPALRRRFDPEYERYAAHVPRLIPRLRPWDPQ